jgi:L-ascorbate metabolism protein UlaG (beta-lactamase superfamily)
VQLTKFTHSCVRFHEGEQALVIDPGIFSEADEALDGASAVLITHEHPDHINADAVRAAAKRDSALRIYAPAPVAASLADLGDQVATASPGESFSTAGFTVETFGGQHALIHPSIPVVPNVGYLIDGRVYHPGDSLIVPTKPVRTLLVPLHAPWSKLSEVVDFTVSVRAAAVTQIHDALLSEIGLQIVEAQLTRMAGEHGSQYRHLAPRESIDV